MAPRGGRGGSWLASSGRGGRGRGSGNRGRGNGAVCRYFSQGQCRFNAYDCNFSHDLASDGDASSVQEHRKPEATGEERAARQDYTTWRRILRAPLQPNDLRTIECLWNQALEILDHGERNWKQMLPRDLTNDDDLHGY